MGRKKIFTGLMSVMLLITAFFSPAAAGAAEAKIDYVAIGDSLAAGQGPYDKDKPVEEKIGTGYTDLIAKKLGEDGKLGSFTKEFSVSGATSADVLAMLQNPKAQQAVKEAELVTLSVGANDLFKVIKVDPTTGKVIYNLEEVQQTMAALQQNLAVITTQLKQLNPQAKIYVMGYYFAFPYLPEGAEKEQAKALSAQLNQLIEGVSNYSGVSFVSVKEFDKNSLAYLPNPQDVHPNEAGYGVMADAFFSVYQAPDRFSDLPASSEARHAILALANAGILNGKTDGTFEPIRNITRAEAAIILAKVVPNLPASPKNPGFKDITPNVKAYTAIAQLTEAGVFAKAPRFHPNQPLTRAQMARLLTVIYGLKGSGSVDFKDVPANFWAKEEIDAVVTNKIMVGSDNQTFHPNNPITRAEFAITIYRILEGLKAAA
ncbi:S-layer homology domain-containing protein [Bacillus sp. B190/17]|uniref:S-layer homology domain-containing protein n=1 Tax=Bacillus lumedeiriae TaxID=3058829 RepID=A0ABW8IC49_9BACI